MLPTIENTFYTEDPNTTTRMWHHWFNIRVRQYMILEILFIISLIMILYRFQTISNKNDRVLERINSMHYRFGNIERKLESLIYLISLKQNEDISPFDISESVERSIANEMKRIVEQSIADELKSKNFPKQNSTDNVQSKIPKTKQSTFETVQNETFPFNAADMKPIIPQGKQSIFNTRNSTLKAPISKEQFRINAADFLRGATVDIAHSSPSILNPKIGYDQSNLVLLDLPRSSSHKAWCTNAKTPILTINLAEYIRPTSVSFQHSKWHGAIPNGAPKIYDVVACLGFYCEKRKPLAFNCQYSPYESNEQMCNISSHLDGILIGKIQFRFLENYGSTEMTCVNLVRVYGEKKFPAKTEQKAILNTNSHVRRETTVLHLMTKLLLRMSRTLSRMFDSFYLRLVKTVSIPLSLA
ncbi:unnamed protein product [Caenorhabditis nigoni]